MHLGYAFVSFARHLELPPGSDPSGGLVPAIDRQAEDITYQVGDSPVKTRVT